jgi:hypothetical protein
MHTMTVVSIGAALGSALSFLVACGGNTTGGPSVGSGSDADSLGDIGSEPLGSPDATVEGGAPDGGRDADAEAGGTSCIPCSNPTPLLIRGIDTGFDRCAKGTLRRRAVVDCPAFLPRVDGGGPCMAGINGVLSKGNACSFDSDCAADAGWGTLATCNQTFECLTLGAAGLYCNCRAGCIRDSDCGPGYVCFCGDPVGQCLPATCTSGGSCASGCDCINPLPAPAQALTGMFLNPRFDCQTPTDECAGVSDCLPASEGLFCGDNGNGHTCFGGGACLE